jgi:hypothetical protein
METPVRYGSVSAAWQVPPGRPPQILTMFKQGVRSRHDSATGIPVRSHHLSGIGTGTAVRGELLHPLALGMLIMIDALRETFDLIFRYDARRAFSRLFLQDGS